MNPKKPTKTGPPPAKTKPVAKNAKAYNAPNHEKATGLKKVANSKGKQEEHKGKQEENYAHIPTKTSFYCTEIPKLENTPILIEVLVRSSTSATQIINSVAEANKKATTKRILAIGLNGKDGEKGNDIKTLNAECAKIIQAMKQAGVAGYCSAFTWTPTTTDEGGYIFPFKEARSLLTLDAGAEDFQNKLIRETGSLIVRSIDEDVINDPLYKAQFSGEIDALAKDLSVSPDTVMTGGYEWHATADTVTERIKTFKLKGKINNEAVEKIVKTINIINKYEHQVRREINNYAERSIYVPEPNTYMHLETRRRGARMNLESVTPNTSQQGEGKLFLYTSPKTSIQYLSDFKTTKPLKGHLDKLIMDLYLLITKGSKNLSSSIEDIIENAHQSHLSEGIIGDIQKWRMKDEEKSFGKSSYMEGTVEKLQLIARKLKKDCAQEILGIL